MKFKLMQFIPIRTLSNIIPINAKLRYLFGAVAEILTRLEALEPQAVETVADTPVEVVAPVAEAVTVDESQVIDGNTSKPFDWKTSDDAGALKQFAADEFDLEIKGNKKADTVRAEIAEYLALKEA